MQVRTPIGNGWILAEDEAAAREPAQRTTAARLLPSGDPYFLLQGAERELLVPDVAHRSTLWTPRVWPGALLVGGEIVGTWRRSGTAVTLRLWRPLTSQEHERIEAEIASMPLPGTRLTDVEVESF